MRNRFLNLGRLSMLALALTVAVGTTGCDSGANEEETVSFTVSSIPVTFTDGSAGIQFFATPTNDIELISVIIKPPVGNSIPFNAGGTLFIENESFGLQDDNTGYSKISGPWTFTFKGNFTTGDQGSFEETVTVNVSA